jgi:hypothetical protein
MRTTVRIDDDLIRALKEKARRDNVSLSASLNQVIRDGLKAKPQKPKPFKQKTHDMGVPRIDLTKAASIAFELDDLELIRKMGLGQ